MSSQTPSNPALSAVAALSPLDGRYHNRLGALRPFMKLLDTFTTT